MTAGSSEPLLFRRSALETFIECPLKWWYSWVLQRQSLFEDLALAWRGSVLHAGLLLGTFQGGKLDDALHEATTHPDFEKLTHAEKLKCNAILVAAHDVFQPMLDRYGTPVVEKTLERTDDGVHYHVTPDAYFPGSRKLFELKTTTSRIDEKSLYWQRAEIKWQPWYYMDELHYHGHEVDSFEWQAIKMPKAVKRTWQPGQDECEYVSQLADEMRTDSDKWFPMIEVQYDEQEAGWQRAQRKKWESTMLWMRDQLWEPAGNTASCYAYNKQCGFFPVCHEGADINNEQLYQIRSFGT